VQVQRDDKGIPKSLGKRPSTSPSSPTNYTFGWMHDEGLFSQLNVRNPRTAVHNLKFQPMEQQIRKKSDSPWIANIRPERASVKIGTGLVTATVAPLESSDDITVIGDSPERRV
jgi:hypothetical protein